MWDILAYPCANNLCIFGNFCVQGQVGYGELIFKGCEGVTFCGIGGVCKGVLRQCRLSGDRKDGVIESAGKW